MVDIPKAWNEASSAKYIDLIGLAIAFSQQFFNTMF